MAGSGSSDWIDQYLEYTEGIPSPDIFRLWSGIATVAGILERRVWAKVGYGFIYPNLYTLLVGPPGVGKTEAIKRTSMFWRSVKELHVAPNNMTKAALLDVLARSSRRLLINAELKEFHSLLAPATEFGTFVPAHDLEFLNTLNDLYDNLDNFREERRHLGNKQIDITNPQLNIIGGTQPSYLANLLPEQAWGMGFMTRVLMIYSAVPKKIGLFSEEHQLREDLRTVLVTQLKVMSKLWGQMSWEPDAAAEAERWNALGCPPVPEHSKLEAYKNRRIVHTIKLAMVSAVSRTGKPVICLEDFSRARGWLLEAEMFMPDVFREMVQKSDAHVVQELHMFLWALWSKDQKPVHKTRLLHFLHTRVPSEKVGRLLDLAEHANIIRRMAGTETYIPVPRNEHGLE